MEENLKKAGRPRKEINWSQFEELCALQCTQGEIASFLKIDAETLRDRAREYYNQPDFSLIYTRFSETGKCSLRRNQYVLSKKNAAMAIWLGKHWLGQKDNLEMLDLPPHLQPLLDKLLKQIGEAQSRKIEESKSRSE